ncbi:MAG: hypothetical protein B6D41_04275, partial [Chloroflexi bacterium UTCFX4]
EALHPTLKKMLKGSDEELPDPDIPKPRAKGDEYRCVLEALRMTLLTVALDDASLLNEETVEYAMPTAYA